jgi:hypothetical protein
VPRAEADQDAGHDARPRCGEYSIQAVVLTTGKLYKQTYFGRLVAEKGKIKLIRESLDTLAGQRAFSKD